MTNFLFKNRGQLLLIIIIIDIFFPAFLAKDQFEIGNIYWLSQIATGTLIIFAAIYLYVKLGEYEYLLNKQAFFASHSPYVNIYYDTKKQVLEIKENAIKILQLPEKKVYRLEDLKVLFNPNDWYEIEQCFVHGHDYKLLGKNGVISIKNQNFTGLYLRYNAHYISSSKYNVDGIVFWFNDDTELKRNELDLIAMLKRYRLIGFEFDMLFNHLPFPLWRREISGEIVFHNNAFEELQQQLGEETQNALNRNILSNLAEEVEKTGKLARTRKHFIQQNNHYIYEFTEQPTGHGNIGYAIDIKKQDQLEKNYNALQEMFASLLELSHHAIIVLNYKRRINRYNQAFLNMFGLDSNWLSTKPGYSQLLDKLRELKKLPEAVDYDEYKETQLHLLAELTSPHLEPVYLPDGQTLRRTIIPFRTGGTILLYENHVIPISGF